MYLRSYASVRRLQSGGGLWMSLYAGLRPPGPISFARLVPPRLMYTPFGAVKARSFVKPVENEGSLAGTPAFTRLTFFPTFT